MKQLNVQMLTRPAQGSEFQNLYHSIRTAILEMVSPEIVPQCESAFADPDICWLLYDTIRRTKPVSVIETGSFMGMSTLISASALAQNAAEGSRRGCIYTISLDNFYRIPYPMSHAAWCARKLQLTPFVRFLEGSSGPFMSMESADPRIAAEREDYQRRLLAEGRECLLHRLGSLLGTVDMAYLDSLHYEASQMSEIAALLEHLGPRGEIIMDDVYFPDRSPSWIVEAFGNTKLADTTVFTCNGEPLRIMKLARSAAYRASAGKLSTWWWPGGLDEFLNRFELRPVPEALERLKH